MTRASLLLLVTSLVAACGSSLTVEDDRHHPRDMASADAGAPGGGSANDLGASTDLAGAPGAPDLGGGGGTP